MTLASPVRTVPIGVASVLFRIAREFITVFRVGEPSGSVHSLPGSLHPPMGETRRRAARRSWREHTGNTEITSKRQKILKLWVCRQATACSWRHEEIGWVRRGDGLFPGAEEGGGKWLRFSFIDREHRLRRTGRGSFRSWIARTQVLAQVRLGQLPRLPAYIHSPAMSRSQ
jgi:ADP-ribose pyrophosphatase YjhB (NUDIX family)